MDEKIVEIDKLPDIFQLIDFLKSKENSIMQATNGWADYTFNGFKPLHAGNFLFNRDRVFINDVPDNQFIVNRLSSKRYCLKPNLINIGFYFVGKMLIMTKFFRPFQGVMQMII